MSQSVEFSIDFNT